MPLQSVVKETKVSQLHVLLVDGELVVGKLDKVLRCPTVQHEELHRRDQSSELMFRRCTMAKEKGSEQMKFTPSSGEPLCCKPSHWVCALPTWNMKVKGEEIQTRLSALLAFAQTWKKPKPPIPSRTARPQVNMVQVASNSPQMMPYVPVMGQPTMVMMMMPSPQLGNGSIHPQQGYYLCQMPPQYFLAPSLPSAARTPSPPSWPAPTPEPAPASPAPSTAPSTVSLPNESSPSPTPPAETVLITDFFKEWQQAPLTVGLQPRRHEASADSSKIKTPEDSSPPMSSRMSEDLLKASSDDSTRASDSEEFAPVRPRKRNKGQRRARALQGSESSDTTMATSAKKQAEKGSPEKPKLPFHTFKALNVDVPSRRPSTSDGATLPIGRKAQASK